MYGDFFVVISGIEGTYRRAFEAGDASWLNPTDANSIEIGEWVFFDPSTGKLSRPTDANPVQRPSYPVWMEPGAYDAQALQTLDYNGKVLLIIKGLHYVMTRRFDPTDTYQPGDALVVQRPSGGGTTKGYLKKYDPANPGFVVGYVVSEGVKDGWLYFHGIW